MSDDDEVGEGQTSKTPGSSRRRRLPRWLKPTSVKESIVLASALVGTVAGLISVAVFFDDDEHILALAAGLPKDRETHISCIGHGTVEPPAYLPEVSVSVVCERLLVDRFDATEARAAQELCRDCPGVTAQHDVTCARLGTGRHELRTKVRGILQDDDGEHRPGAVYSQPVVVTCTGSEADE